MPQAHDQEKSSAPGDLDLVRRFVNSYDAETGSEDLDGPAGLENWLERTGLGDGEEPSDADVARAIDTREALRSLLLANNGVDVSDGAAERLNAALADASSKVQFEGTSATLVPTCGGVDAALARMALVVHDAMLSGEWARLKVCPADDCQWAFYDRSRNRSRTWCQMEDCGNRAKVKAFRERKSR